MKTFLKFRSLTSKTSKDSKRTYDIIRNKRLYCSDYKSLNDPLEGYLSQSLSENIERKSGYKICCFSKFTKVAENIKTIPLWVHYANGFKGCVIEFTLKDEKIKKIKYLNEKEYIEFVNKFKNKMALKSEEIESLLSTKVDAWKYEKEFRFISNQDSSYLKINIKKVWIFKDGRKNSDTRKSRGISKDCENMIVDICNKKGIPCEKIYFEDFMEEDKFDK